MTPALYEAAAAAARALTDRGWRVVTAESCTGGLIAATCTGLSGSSQWFDRGFVTYSNQAKIDQLGVSPELLAQHGAVSEPVARAMAQGALQRSAAQVAVAVTGIAGPSGQVPGKPVGTVHLAVAAQGLATRHARFQFEGDRQAVREAAVCVALSWIEQAARPPVNASSGQAES